MMPTNTDLSGIELTPFSLVDDTYKHRLIISCNEVIIIQLEESA